MPGNDEERSERSPGGPRSPYDRHDTPLLATSIAGTAVPLDRRIVARTLWRYRWFTAAVIARIHWQALRLALKRVPAFAKPAPPPTLTTR